MKVAVITPIGPGHLDSAREALDSVEAAWRHDQGPFRERAAVPVLDLEGRLGRSRARNRGMWDVPDADWYFFLDADDRMELDAFRLAHAPLEMDDECMAVFGAVQTVRHGVVRENRWPIGWGELLKFAAEGTLSMGCFVRGPEARLTPFDESLDVAEDFEWYLRLLEGRAWSKLRWPLVLIGDDVPSAGGPRGYDQIDWHAECRAVVDRWRARGPKSCQERTRTRAE